MSGIEFEDTQAQENKAPFQAPVSKGIVGWLIKKNIAKDTKNANIILISCTIIFFGISIMLFSANNSSKLTPEQVDASKKYIEDLINGSKRN